MSGLRGKLRIEPGTRLLRPQLARHQGADSSRSRAGVLHGATSTGRPATKPPVPIRMVMVACAGIGSRVCGLRQSHEGLLRRRNEALQPPGFGDTIQGSVVAVVQNTGADLSGPRARRPARQARSRKMPRAGPPGRMFHHRHARGPAWLGFRPGGTPNAARTAAGNTSSQARPTVTKTGAPQKICL